jgi:hypothetical protein
MRWQAEDLLDAAWLAKPTEPGVVPGTTSLVAGIRRGTSHSHLTDWRDGTGLRRLYRTPDGP